MNIRQHAIEKLDELLPEENHPNISAADRRNALETFFQTYGSKAFAFYPEYPALPALKYLLWNHENLRPALKKILFLKIMDLRQALVPDSTKNVSKLLEAASTEFPAEQSPADTDKNKPGEVPTADPTKHRTLSKTGFLEVTREPDAFDRFLDLVALLVRGLSFS